MNETTQSPGRWRSRFLALLALVVGVPALLGIGLLARFGGDVAVDYADDEAHFKYGSTGGEHEFGFPYWIWQALPQVCAEHLPGPGYAGITR